MTQKDKDAEHEKNKREFLEIVFTPAKLQKACDDIDHSGSGRKAENYVGYWVNQFKGDTPTMDRIIETYMTGEVLGGFVLSRSIDVVEGKDSRFFEGLYDRLAAMEDPREFSRGYVPNIAQELDGSQVPHAQFKMQTLRNWHAKVAAIGRVTDEAYLKRVVEEVPDDCDFACESPQESPQEIAVSRIADQSFLERVLETKKDAFIVKAAIRRLTNKKLLEQYANMLDRECDLFFQEKGKRLYEPEVMWKTEDGNRAYDAVSNNGKFRVAARERLAELK